MGHKNQNKSKSIVGIGVTPPVTFDPNNDISPLGQFDGETLQEMVNLNNTYSSLLKQKSQFDAALTMLSQKRDQIAKGIIPMPVMIQVTRTLSHAESDKNKVLIHVDEEIKNIKLAKQGMMGALEHRRDEYVECVIRVTRMLNEKVKNQEIKTIYGIRSRAVSIEEDEKKSMEKEFEKLIKEKA